MSLQRLSYGTWHTVCCLWTSSNLKITSTTRWRAQQWVLHLPQTTQTCSWASLRWTLFIPLKIYLTTVWNVGSDILMMSSLSLVAQWNNLTNFMNSWTLDLTPYDLRWNLTCSLYHFSMFRSLDLRGRSYRRQCFGNPQTEITFYTQKATTLPLWKIASHIVNFYVWGEFAALK